MGEVRFYATIVKNIIYAIAFFIIQYIFIGWPLR